MKLHQPLECLSKDKDKDRSRSRRGHRRDAVRSTKRARFAAVLVRDGYVSITVYIYIVCGISLFTRVSTNQLFNYYLLCMSQLRA